MDKNPDYHYVEKATVMVRANPVNDALHIWACGGPPVPPNKKIVWEIPGFDGTKKSMVASLQECTPEGSSPVIGTVIFTLHSAAISADGTTVRLVFEHDGDQDKYVYASIWLAQNGVLAANS